MNNAKHKLKHRMKSEKWSWCPAVHQHGNVTPKLTVPARITPRQS